jgi:hypothetical protein
MSSSLAEFVSMRVTEDKLSESQLKDVHLEMKKF